jgi:hypothetical protein
MPCKLLNLIRKELMEKSHGLQRLSNTVTAIETFQSRFTSSVDGLIKPDSQTWHALLDAAGELDQPDVSSAPGGFFFPFPAPPAIDWIRSPRSFASNRSNAPAPTPVAITATFWRVTEKSKQQRL